MKPENHAIRQLEKQCENALPEIGMAIDRVIVALAAYIANRKDDAAYTQAKKQLEIELAALEKARGAP